MIRRIVKRVIVTLLRQIPESSEIDRMRAILTHHNIDLVFDVGANVGQYAIFLRELGYRGKIVSFEPLSAAHRKLLAVSRRDPLWEVAPRMAIGENDGEVVLNIAANSQSSSVLGMLDAHRQFAPESAYIGSEKVGMQSLNSVAPRYIGNTTRNIFLKIDVQGLEWQVIEGASQILPMIRGIQLESSLTPLYQGETLFRDMIDRMDNLGYELYGVSPGFIDMKTGRMTQVDGVFFKK